MASGFFAVFDDIAVLMDDVATMSKVTTKKRLVSQQSKSYPQQDSVKLP